MPPNTTLSPSFPRRQIGRLRWPIAWLGGCVLTAGLLALLVRQLPARPLPALPANSLSASLQPPRAPAARAASPAPAPAITQPAPRAGAQQPPARLEPGLRLAEAKSEPQAQPANLGEAPPAPPSPAPAGGSIAAPTPGQGTADDSNTAPGPGPVGRSAKLKALPIAQRCPQQIKPGFPKIALEDGIEQGRVLLRLHLDVEGKVKSVEILETSPAGYFEAASRRAALQWRCLPSGEAGDSVRVPFIFG